MTTENKQNESKRIGWGVKVPYLSLEEVIDITRVIYNKAGETHNLDALSRVTGNSSSSSTFNKKVSALKNFGVFIIDKSSYTLTELGKRIAKPESFEQQAEAIIEAFLNQENLKKIWEYFKGKKLPQDEFLENTIVNLIKIPAELKNNWAEYFVAAGKYAGLLEERGSGSYQVLSGYTPSKNNNEAKKEEPYTTINKEVILNEMPAGDKQKTDGHLPIVGLLDRTWGILNIKSISDNRKAIIAIPEQLTQQDIDSVKVLLKGIEVQLEGLKKFDE